MSDCGEVSWFACGATTSVNGCWRSAEIVDDEEALDRGDMSCGLVLAGTRMMRKRPWVGSLEASEASSLWYGWYPELGLPSEVEWDATASMEAY